MYLCAVLHLTKTAAFMELFYTQDICNNICTLDEQESTHCTKVLRHKEGDVINVIDGYGNLLECRIVKAHKKCTELQIISRSENFGAHEYNLTMAVCPTKNMERYEWFLEKATEIGTDTIVPVIGEHSERKSIKPERCNKILLSAAKQSLKGAVPQLLECCSMADFIASSDLETDGSSIKPLKLIAYCGESTKSSVKEALESYLKTEIANLPQKPHIIILIGPEGDFSAHEVELATKHGFIPIHLGKSRLRTETAAVVSCSMVYTVIG